MSKALQKKKEEENLGRIISFHFHSKMGENFSFQIGVFFVAVPIRRHIITC